MSAARIAVRRRSTVARLSEARRCHTNIGASFDENGSAMMRVSGRKHAALLLTCSAAGSPHHRRASPPQGGPHQQGCTLAPGSQSRPLLACHAVLLIEERSDLDAAHPGHRTAL